MAKAKKEKPIPRTFLLDNEDAILTLTKYGLYTHSLGFKKFVEALLRDKVAEIKKIKEYNVNA